MTTREEVSQELLDYAEQILKELYNDYKKLPCRGTVTSLISCLYETAIISFTLKYNDGIANYKYVRQDLCGKYVTELVKVRDDLIHNFNKSVDYKQRIFRFLQQFGNKNFNTVWNQCIDVPSIYDDLMKFCTMDSESATSTIKPITVF